LILSDTKAAKVFAPYLVSHGFVWASVDRIDTWFRMTDEMFNQPLDILFVLDQVSTIPPEDLVDVIDSEKVGVTGYSFGGQNTYALSGARIDPDYYLAQCPNPDATTESILNSNYLSAFSCSPADNWDEFSAIVDEAITHSEDGMWQAMTDKRIRAVMPMSGEGWWLFGERGLSTVSRPVLIIVGTADKLYLENVLIFNHLGTNDKALISFIGDGHMVMVENRAHITRIAHFMVAFFGYQLQGREEFEYFYSEDYVDQFDDLAWGVYVEE
jgi:predicted dienelactone hydrolase